MSAGRAGAGAHILVVDDDPAILRVVRMNLARHDFRVEAASTGQEALDAVADWHPDAILLISRPARYRWPRRHPASPRARGHADHYPRARCRARKVRPSTSGRTTT